MNSDFRCKCPITSALDIVGDKWTLVIIKQMLLEEKKTFKDFSQSDEAIASNILSSRLKMLEKYKMIRKEKREINRTRVKVVKNKVAPPFRLAEFDIMYGQGISKAGELIDLGVEHDILTKSGSWFSYGDTRLGQGRDTVKQLFIDNPELAEEVEAKIKAVLAAAE